MHTDKLARLSPEQARRRRKLTLELLWVCAFALLPWTIYLAVSLPDVYSTRHWAVAWAGFDALELIALGMTAYYGWRGRQALVGTAIAAATLLICDAWFDITLNLGTPDIWWSLGSAAFIELPLAFFLINRVSLLLRLTASRFFPDGDEDGKPMRFSKLPLIALLPWDAEPTAEPADEPAVEFDDASENSSEQKVSNREPGAS